LFHKKFKSKDKITLSQIIGGIVRSTLKAQDASSLHMFDTIHKMVTITNGELHPKYITLKDNDKTYNLPLLSLIPISHMQINEVNVTFDANILHVLPDDTHSKEEDFKMYNIPYEPIKIITEFNSDKSNVHVNIKLQNTPLPTKLRNYLSSLDHLEKLSDTPQN